jgi:hypothetical protein
VVTLESLLIGHEDWVHSVRWQPLGRQGQQGQQGQQQAVPERGELALLSASMDRSMILWRCDAASGLWLNMASVGDAGAQCLGYFGGVFSPDAAYIMAHGFTGGRAGCCVGVWGLGRGWGLDKRQVLRPRLGMGQGEGAGQACSGAAAWRVRELLLLGTSPAAPCAPAGPGALQAPPCCRWARR